MKRIFFATALFVMSLQNIAFCQTDSIVLKNAVSKLKALIVDHITEKAYLHFDRPYPYYVAGDMVYFKAYITKGERHEPTNISGILHVDLIGKNDILMQSIVLKLRNGIGWGDFTLPDTLQKGSYRIRAYTEWMRNTEHPYFFDRYISVSSINSVDRVTEAIKPGAGPSLQFFPEGGNLVADIHSKVAFKAVGPDGLGINVKGVILDNTNKEIAKITSAHLGMGVFDIIPEEGRTYKARVTYADGSQSAVDLPAVETKGITLSVNTDDPAKVSIEINANRAYYKANLNKDLNMIIYGSGVVRTIKTKLDNAVLGVDLPASSFSTGILQVMLMSQTGEPLNERMIFIQNHDQLNLSLTTNKTTFAKRENVQLNLNAKNKEGSAVNGSFSVSVVDESKLLVDESMGNTILSYLLLTSDVKGYVEKPNYYFAGESKETRANLDALMLTQGYRRFAWKQLLNDNSVAIAGFMPEVNIDIAGVFKTNAGNPIINSNVLLINKTNGSTLTQQTDEQGRFRFSNVDFLSGTRFLIKIQSPFGKNGAILTLDKPAPGPAIIAGSIVDVKYNTTADILASFQNTERPAVVTASNESTKVLFKGDKAVETTNQDKNYRSTKIGGSGNADQVIRADQILGGTSLSDDLKGLARGVDFSNGVPYLQNSMVIEGGRAVSEPMLIIVDGVTSSSVDIVAPSEVESVEILKGPNASIYGVRGGAGVLIINIKQQGDQISISKETAPGIFSITPRGLYKAREFYAPSYDITQPGNKIPGNNTTIFWKPNVSTDAQGNTSFNFFNADAAGRYRVEVQGIDSKGNLGWQVFRFKVE